MTALSQLSNLKLRIQEKMLLNKDYFVRLSSRSPKDAVVLSQEEAQSKSSLEQMELKYEKMRVVSADQAMLLLCKSQRVAEDVAAFLAFKAKYDSLNVVLRDWMPKLPFDK